MGLGGSLQDPANLFLLEQKRNIQILACAFSLLSVVASLVTIYWFFMMKRNFRRHLILLLILGDCFKSTWYLVFAAAALAGANVSTTTQFCQANGFLLQAAVEACDIAILFMSLHMSLQIFSTKSKIFGHDGLYRFRHTVLCLYILLPLLSASLGFTRSHQAYILQGAFCTLPIRPYWYRLALTWIPRYLIWAYIMFVALRIYMHVGNGFKVFAREAPDMSSRDMGSENEETFAAPKELHVLKRKQPPASMVDPHDTSDANSSAEGLASSNDGTGHPLTSFDWPSASTFPADSDVSGPTVGTGSRRGSRVAFQADSFMNAESLQVPSDQKAPHGSISSISSFKSIGDASAEGNRPVLEPIEENRADQDGSIDMTSADTPLNKRRRAIQRQLRLLFIYPTVYMIMWTVPFVYHGMNYSNYYAQHPIYVLVVFAVIFQTSLGFVDCTVFGWREKPWKHIPGSDGTFLGSFMFWRFYHQRSGPATPPTYHYPEMSAGRVVRASKSRFSMRSASHNSSRPNMHKKTWSGSSDRTASAAEQAAARLALERAERGRSLPEYKSASTNNKPPMEWWDRRLSHAVLDTPTQERDSFNLH